jgi:hypothetical protein
LSLENPFSNDTPIVRYSARNFKTNARRKILQTQGSRVTPIAPRRRKRIENSGDSAARRRGARWVGGKPLGMCFLDKSIF